MTFDEFRAARKEAAAGKYTVWHCRECGRIFNSPTMFYQHLALSSDRDWCKGALDSANAAMHRNCAYDVAQKLADAVNILELWQEKDVNAVPLLSPVLQLEKMGRMFLRLAESGVDEYPVKRLVPLV